MQKWWRREEGGLEIQADMKYKDPGVMVKHKH